MMCNKDLQKPRKFGKTIVKRQLDVPEYAASFVNYKGLKKLIKSLGAGDANNAGGVHRIDPQQILQANKATFFFRLERELEKVNAFYLQKEAELKLRLKTLVDKKKAVQMRGGPRVKISTTYITLREGFQQFEHDLSKLQQFVEVNATAFSKILKKWDKTSKSRTKELYISRAVELQPCFNREVISELSDQATTSLLELEAWAEGENIEFTTIRDTETIRREAAQSEDDPEDVEIRNAVLSESGAVLKEWLNRLQAAGSSERAMEKVTAIFLASIAEGSEQALRVLEDSGLINFHAADEINERNCLHEAAIAGKFSVLKNGISNGVDVGQADIYGRIPLHYAAMHGRVDMVELLISVKTSTIDMMDHDNHTPLIHAIVHNERDCVRRLISSNARLDPRHEQDFIPLNLACQHGFEEIASILLESGASIMADAEGLFPQHLVARSGQSVQLLLLLQKYGANMNEPDKLFQWTPIFHAASEGHLNCVRVLLDAGAHATILDEKGLSATYYAAWEGHMDCVQLLSAAGRGVGVVGPMLSVPSPLSVHSTTPSAIGMSMDPDGIPDLALPPPILPLRRYGHNFLENKTLVQLSFEEMGAKSVFFDQESKFPASRLTISSKSSDLIPRNLLLPLNEDSRSVSFQIDTLETFAIDFDIYPTFGSKVLARTIALADTFQNRNFGQCVLPLFDTRMRTVGRISFEFRVIKPFQGTPLEITHFATYWKATSQLDQHSSALITGSSLAGDYICLHIQVSGDSVPLLHPQTSISIAGGIDVPIRSLSYSQFREKHITPDQEAALWTRLKATTTLSQAYSILSHSLLSLAEVLDKLPPSVHIDLNIIHPVSESAGQNVNAFVDTILNAVFDHARALKRESSDLTRSIVFSSSDMNVCTALNWKQPNYPVFFTNDPAPSEQDIFGAPLAGVNNACSVKDAVRFAAGNNLMGLICPSSLLETVPALAQSIKSSGLVVVAQNGKGRGTPQLTGVDGVMKEEGVLVFEETIDM